MFRDAREDVTEAGLGIEAVELGSLDQGVDRRRALAILVGAGEVMSDITDGAASPGTRPAAQRAAAPMVASVSKVRI
jgi:hypothetical protein